jgi:hypothetical protein
MQRMIGPEVANDWRVYALQECGAHRRILNVDLAATAGERAIGAAATQIAAAFARVVILARQLLSRRLATETGDERERASARSDGCIDDTRQQPIERENERDNVADDSVTKLEARLHR